MKKDPKFYHVPGWFEYVSALGASLLVDATGKLFRDYKPNGPDRSIDYPDDESYLENNDSENEVDFGNNLHVDAGASAHDARLKGKSFSKPSQGQALLSLEYLVSNLSIFDVTQPHDAIYALLAIAKDTVPSADDQTGFRRLVGKAQRNLETFVHRKRYTVDYQQPFADVCKEFVQFCFVSSKDKTRALDIICRPWAPEVSTRTTRMRKSGRKVSTNGVDDGQISGLSAAKNSISR